jgi:Complex 1 protein (LYR family)
MTREVFEVRHPYHARLAERCTAGCDPYYSTHHAISPLCILENAWVLRREAAELLPIALLSESFLSLDFSPERAPLAAAMSQRHAALGLYRRALRVARDWKVPNERDYIRTEARTEANRGRGVDAGSEEATALLIAAERRLTIAEHYKIPYPRPFNVPPGTTGVGPAANSGYAVPQH